MGYALLEANSCGLPAIRSDSTSLDEVCPEDICKTVPAGHTEKMANAIQLLIEDPQLRSNLGKESRKYVKSNYNVIIFFTFYRLIRQGKNVVIED